MKAIYLKNFRVKSLFYYYEITYPKFTRRFGILSYLESAQLEGLESPSLEVAVVCLDSFLYLSSCYLTISSLLEK